jgi:hypothetical protein
MSDPYAAPGAPVGRVAALGPAGIAAIALCAAMVVAMAIEARTLYAALVIAAIAPLKFLALVVGTLALVVAAAWLRGSPRRAGTAAIVAIVAFALSFAFAPHAAGNAIGGAIGIVVVLVARARARRAAQPVQ